MSTVRAVLCLVVPLLAACSTVRVQTDYDPAVDFSAYHTFAWMAVDGAASASPDLTTQRVHSAVESTLGALGYRRVDPASADLLVTHSASVDQRIHVDQAYRGYGYRHAGYTETWVDVYDEGELMIELVDAQRERVVWQGVAQARVNPQQSPQEREQQVREAVAAIFKSFPPR